MAYWPIALSGQLPFLILQVQLGETDFLWVSLYVSVGTPLQAAEIYSIAWTTRLNEYAKICQTWNKSDKKSFAGVPVSQCHIIINLNSSTYAIAALSYCRAMNFLPLYVPAWWMLQGTYKKCPLCVETELNPSEIWRATIKSFYLIKIFKCRPFLHQVMRLWHFFNYKLPSYVKCIIHFLSNFRVVPVFNGFREFFEQPLKTTKRNLSFGNSITWIDVSEIHIRFSLHVRHTHD